MTVKWRLAYQGEALVVSSGLVYTKTTKPKGLQIEQIKEMIKQKPRASYYQTGITRRVTLGDNIARTNPEMIGREIEFFSSVDLADPEHDRIFDKLPLTGKELMNKHYKSRPIKL